MGGRYYFQSVHTCGRYPVPGLWGGYPIPGLGVPHPRSGSTPSQVWVRGYPISGMGWVGGTPTRSGWWGVPGVPPDQAWIVGVPGVPPNQVWMVGVPRVPPTRSGWWRGTWGTPPPGLDWYPPPPGLDGVTPHHQNWMGYLPPPGLDGVPPPIRQSSLVSTCYMAGSVPLAFMLEDFLVCKCFMLHY